MASSSRSTMIGVLSRVMSSNCERPVSCVSMKNVVGHGQVQVERAGRHGELPQDPVVVGDLRPLARQGPGR